MLFAHLKRILRLGCLRLRGPAGARDKFLLAATAQNLRKLAKLRSTPTAFASRTARALARTNPWVYERPVQKITLNQHDRHADDTQITFAQRLNQRNPPEAEIQTNALPKTTMRPGHCQTQKYTPQLANPVASARATKTVAAYRLGM